MYAKLTYICTLFCAACLAHSCSSDNDTPPMGKGDAMTFAVSDVSRASETPAFTIFAIYGDMKFPVDNTTVPTVVFNKTEVEYKDDSWSYEGTQYWFPQHEHSFVAVNPLSVLEPGNAPLYSNSQLSFTYTLPVSSDNRIIREDVTDILVATHRRLYGPEDKAGTTVLRFGHIMSQINFAPALDDNNMTGDEFIEIHKLEFTGFKTGATFNIVPSQRQTNSLTDDRLITVTGLTAPGNLSVEFEAPVQILNNHNNVTLFGDNDALIMLPQSFTADGDAEITLSYTTSFDPSTLQQLTIPFLNKDWEPGRSYTYKFTVNRRGLISESTEITEWEMVNVGNINAH